MRQKIRIKDIAKMAGVSPGTVDRVIHGRGNISQESRAAVEKVLKEVDYHPNLHVSALSMHRQYIFNVITPQFKDGEYWDDIQSGILRAIKEFDGINIACNFFRYNQFDLFSCRKVYEESLKSKHDAVIIGPTFKDETIFFTSALNDKKIPYVYVDSMVYGTTPVASFTADQNAFGYLISRLIHQISPENSEFVLCQAVRIGDESSNNTVLRKAGFMDYCKSVGDTDKVYRLNFSVLNPEENEERIGDFFARHPNVHGAVVLSSRGNVICDYIYKHNIKGVKVVCLDLTADNLNALNNGRIDFLLGQRPAQQGFLAVRALMQHLVYGTPMDVENHTPLDILTKENIKFYKEFE